MSGLIVFRLFIDVLSHCNYDGSVTGSTPTLVAIKRTVNDVGGVPNTGVAAPSSTVVKLPKIAQNMAVASTARTVPVSMNNN